MEGTGPITIPLAFIPLDRPAVPRQVPPRPGVVTDDPRDRQDAEGDGKAVAPGADVHELFLANFFAQTKALAFGKTADEVRAEGTAEEIVPARVFSGNRPTTSIIATKPASPVIRSAPAPTPGAGWCTGRPSARVRAAARRHRSVHPNRSPR